MEAVKKHLVQTALAAGLVMLFVGYVARAHHSIALQFDMTSEIVVVGNILEMEWRNPHSWLHVEVENEAGDLEVWRVEFGSANSLYRRGWRQGDLPIGAEVTIHGLAARDGSRQMEGDGIAFADGRSLFSGSRPQ